MVDSDQHAEQPVIYFTIEFNVYTKDKLTNTMCLCRFWNSTTSEYRELISTATCREIPLASQE